MNRKQEALALVLEQKLLPLYYHDDFEICKGVLGALYEAGIRAVEFTNRGVHAIDHFISLKKLAAEKMPGMQLGVGTIKTTVDAELFIAADAAFIVCPIVNPDVARLVHKAGLLWVPGCLTTTEIFMAETNGAHLVKIFPGNVVGPSYISAIRELFPGLLFMPTGGVDGNVENLKSWFDSGVSVVGMGSKLITKPIIEERDFGKLAKDAKTVLDTIKKVSK